jgi:hypothetical protein
MRGTGAGLVHEPQKGLSIDVALLGKGTKQAQRRSMVGPHPGSHCSLNGPAAFAAKVRLELGKNSDHVEEHLPAAVLVSIEPMDFTMWSFKREMARDAWTA